MIKDYSQSELEYLNNRVDTSIKWYTKKSIYFKKLEIFFRTIELIFALSIPILVYFTKFNGIDFSVLIAILGTLISLIVTIHSIYKFQYNYIQYKSILSSLLTEKFLFITKSGSYQGTFEDTFSRFVENIEAILNEQYSRNEFFKTPKSTSFPEKFDVIKETQKEDPDDTEETDDTGPMRTKY